MKELLTRSITGALFVAAIIAACYAGEYGLLGIGTVVFVIGSWEVRRALPAEQRAHANAQILHVALLVAALWTMNWDFKVALSFTIVSVLVLLIGLLAHENFGSITASGAVLLTSMWILLGVFGLLGIFSFSQDWLVVLGVFILVWTNDTFAYLTGRVIGKTKLWERVSPKKTIEGSLGGLVFTLGAGAVLAHFMDQSMVYWLGAAFVAAIFGALGDLVESSIKRNLGVKDLGNILPGHGGVLDRFDAILLAAPAVFIWSVFVAVS